MSTASNFNRSRLRGRRSPQWVTVGRACWEVLEGRRLLSFTPAVNYPVGAGPQAVVTADFNNDGHLDLATANPGFHSVSVLLGDGGGGFGGAINSAGTTNTTFERASITVADFNNDGNLDLATAMYGYYNEGRFGRLDVRLGNGDGTFQLPTYLPVGGAPLAVAAGDFNNNGNCDLVVTFDPDGLYGFVQVLLGSGQGSFGPAQPIQGGIHSELAVGDFNGDGNIDAVAVAGESGSYGEAFLGNGAGGLLTGNAFYSSIYWLPARALAVGDFSGNGIPDLVVSGGGVEIFAGLDNGTFEAPIVHSANGNEHTGVAVADFNGDGRFDVVTSDGDTGTVSLLLGNGDRTLRYIGAFPTGSSPSAVAVGDFNGDGRPDVAAANAGSNNVSVLLNTTDNQPPSAGAAEFPFLLSPHRITIPFSEPVGASLSLSDITVQNLTTVTTVNPVSMSYDAATNVATFSFAGVLPDGNYRAVIAAANVIDLAGNPMAADFTFEFFVLAGDANRDRSVNISDFSILASRFNLPGTFSQGDFNYDGTTEIGDFAILASGFNTGLEVPRAAASLVAGALPGALLPFSRRKTQIDELELRSALTDV